MTLRWNSVSCQRLEFTDLFFPSPIFFIVFHFYSKSADMIKNYTLAASKCCKLCNLQIYEYKHYLMLFAAKFSAAWAISGNENQYLL